jgi:hypothetical protein
MDFLFGGPDPPDPIATAGAQTGSNVSTAIANANLGNVNQVTPQGNLTYSTTGNYNWTDPTTGYNYSIPQFTATQTPAAGGQDTITNQIGTQRELSGLAYNEVLRLQNQFATPFNLNGAPAFGNASTLANAPQAQGTFADAGQIGRTFGDSGDIQRSYQHGDDFSADRQRIEAGLMQRLDPSLAMERNKYEQQLSDQGIRYGSPAYEDAMRNYSMQANDARLGVIGKGGEEQQRLSEMARAAGEFSNNANQQQYEQLYGRANFANAAQQQQFAQNAQRGTFANAALAQNFQQAGTAFNAANAARQQYLDEQFALRNQPINEISALLSGSQVSKPSFLNTGGATIPTTDVAGLINRNFDQQMAVSNQQSATANNIIGGLFGFAGGLGRGGFFNK